MRARRTAWLGAIALAGALALAPQARAAAPDSWVTAKVKIALVAAEGVPGARVHVDTTDGRVTLFGDVPTAAAKAEAERVARGIEGVASVRNQLVVSNAPGRDATRSSDAELKKDVERALAHDRSLEGSEIEVRSVQGGVVHLAGRAKTFSEHRRAIGIAAGVGGVRRVESEVAAPDELTDAEIGHDGDYDAVTYAKSAASDMWITTATKTRLLADPETPGMDINVDTADGVVTLFGTVSSEQAKRRAEADARKVAGVRSVENALQIVPATSQPEVAHVDAELAKEVERRIGERQQLADDDISVEVENAVVRLTGSIDGASDRLAALTAARGVVGVTRVIDDLRIEPPQVGAR